MYIYILAQKLFRTVAKVFAVYFHLKFLHKYSYCLSFFNEKKQVKTTLNLVRHILQKER